jgi:hypothetical protein
MTDAGRKDFSTKIQESVTPDSQKTTFDKAKETVTDGLDKTASALTPEQDKSFTQNVGDHVQKGHDNAQKTWTESAAEVLENGKKAVADAAEYVSETITGATEGAKDGAQTGTHSTTTTTHSEIRKP